MHDWFQASRHTHVLHRHGSRGGGSGFLAAGGARGTAGPSEHTARACAAAVARPREPAAARGLDLVPGTSRENHARVTALRKRTPEPLRGFDVAPKGPHHRDDALHVAHVVQKGNQQRRSAAPGRGRGGWKGGLKKHRWLAGEEKKKKKKKKKKE
jgi:hypothetical protein